MQYSPQRGGSYFHISSNSNGLNYCLPRCRVKQWKFTNCQGKAGEFRISLSPRRERVRVRGKKRQNKNHLVSHIIIEKSLYWQHLCVNIKSKLKKDITVTVFDFDHHNNIYK